MLVVSNPAAVPANIGTWFGTQPATHSLLNRYLKMQGLKNTVNLSALIFIFLKISF